MTRASEHPFPWLKTYPPGIQWDSDLPVSPLSEMLDRTADVFGGRPAFDFLGHSHTWSDIRRLSLSLARGLQDSGVGKGTRVGLFLPNCPYFLIAYYALMRLGAVAVNMNPLYAKPEIEGQVDDSGMELLITLDLALLYDKIRHLPGRASALKRIVVCPFTDILPFPKNILFRAAKGRELARPAPSDPVLRFHDLVSRSGAPDPVAIDPLNDIAVLQYTGGTTGTPKGAMLTHANLSANAAQAALWLGAEPGRDRMLGVIPFFHVFAMTAVMNLAVRQGMEIVALPRFDLDQTLKLIHKKKPQVFPAVPAIFNAINNHRDLARYDLSSLRYCVSGGAPLPMEVKRAFEAKTGCVVVEGYGLTESSPVLCCNPVSDENRAGSVGLPFPRTVIEIVSPETGAALAQGERGEICARGPQVMKGYWNRPGDTAAILKNGLLHTGDIGFIDADGYVHVVDRIKDMIITNGYNVYPRNVEEAIYKHEGVEECIVAGLADENRGEVVKAWVKRRAGCDVSAEDLRAFLKNHISPMEIPRHIEFRHAPLPRTMIGKLSRKDVLAQEGQRL